MGPVWSDADWQVNTTAPAFLQRVGRVLLELGPKAPVDLHADGSLRLAWNTTPFRFLIKNDGHPLLVSQAVVCENLDFSLGLLVDLNVINAGIVSARVFYDLGWVIAQAEVPAQDLTARDVTHAAWAIGSLVDWAATEILESFGGDRYTDPSALTVPASAAWPTT